MKKQTILSLLILSIVTLFFASCGEMKNNGNTPNIISDDNTYVAVGEFKSDVFTLPNRTVAVDVDLDKHVADMTFYNFSLDGKNMMNIIAKGLKLENTKTTCDFTINEVIPIIKSADKEILFQACPLMDVKGKIDVEAKTMVITLTLKYTTPFNQTMEIPTEFNGQLLLDKKDKDNAIPEDAKKVVDYEEEYGAKGVLMVDGKIIPDNKIRIAIDKDEMKAVMYLATLSLDNGNSFVTLEAQGLNVKNVSKGYELAAETVVPSLETGSQSIYFPACTFEKVEGMINNDEKLITVNLDFVYVDPKTAVQHRYPASFIGSMIDPDEVDEPVENALYDNDFLASGLFTADNFEIDDRMVGVDVDMNTMTADITFYAFSYADVMPEITAKAKGLHLQKSGNVYNLSVNELTPYVQAGGEEIEFKDARFVSMLGTVDADNKTMQISFILEYTDPNTNAVSELAANYEGELLK